MEPIPTSLVDIRAIIFDLDGVLVNSRHLHYEALNWALARVDEKMVISVEEHIAKYDGLSTKVKLELLTREKGLSPYMYQQVWRWKQEHTVTLIHERIKVDEHLRALLQRLKSEGYMLMCASNSVRMTLEDTLECLGVGEFFDAIYSNQDVEHPKPHPNIYLRCFVDQGLAPQQCVVVEDSPMGRMAADLSGAHVCAVAGPTEVTYERIRRALSDALSRNESRRVDVRWLADVQVVIPMAGAGSRFASAGYELPKPLIDVRGKPMVQWVIDNLAVAGTRFTFIVQQDHLNNEEWDVYGRLQAAAPGCVIVPARGLTQGAACTVLLAEHQLDPDRPLLIANADQFVECNMNAFLYEAQSADGCISVFHQPDASDCKWSYARLGDTGLVEEVREKEPISDLATTGIYYWTRAGDFFECAREMMKKDIRVNGEFYVCPVYNEAIEKGMKIKVSRCQRMWGLGTPADLEHFLECYELH